MRKKPPGIGAYLHLRRARSTQDLARRLAAEGAPAWSLVRADRQSRGRGRGQRRWSSGAGGLYFSIVLRPRIAPRSLARLSLRTGRIFARTLAKTTGLTARVKAPNDVLAKAKAADPFRKICGILIEASSVSRQVDWVVIGAGINVNNRLPRSLPQAASLKRLTGRALDPDEILKQLIRALRAAYGGK